MRTCLRQRLQRRRHSPLPRCNATTTTYYLHSTILRTRRDEDDGIYAPDALTAHRPARKRRKTLAHKTLNGVCRWRDRLHNISSLGSRDDDGRRVCLAMRTGQENQWHFRRSNERRLQQLHQGPNPEPVHFTNEQRSKPS